MSKCILLVPLLIAVYMACSVSAQGGVARCCRKIKGTEVTLKKLKSYHVQESSSCHLPAVVFTTVRNKRICAEPNQPWTNKSMAYLDEKENRRRPHFLSKNSIL
ncbi:unnamed protein product [Gadus morhua 'NCC']|uniref:C-C motif chemokine 2-like n=1 Tax=Gadus morhua TaxID=8049 RepID=A0A8C5FDU2_GADMO